MINTKPEKIDKQYRLSADNFLANYVNKSKPVIISGVMSKHHRLHQWSLEYFENLAPELNLIVKDFSQKDGIQMKHTTLKEYANTLKRYEKTKNSNSNLELPPYCHDLPLFSLINLLIKDVQPFPFDYLPKWYWYKWWRYCQFFIGASGSITPLHFDCLLTNNLFFQIMGRKQFTLIPPDDSKYCYKYAWRWFRVDPENPDFNRYPKYKNAKPIKFIVNPGDILYIPPGTLHHVKSLDMSISFNIDWHTKQSVLNSLASISKGMPAKNLAYNFLIALGLILKIHPSIIFPFYKSYLNYIS
jgi:ribosomal protein L16 Arg81 hydroxylase